MIYTYLGFRMFDFSWNVGKLFPLIIQFMYLGAMITYLLQKNYQQAFYWLSACMITFSVTWMVMK